MANVNSAVQLQETRDTTDYLWYDTAIEKGVAPADCPRAYLYPHM